MIQTYLRSRQQNITSQFVYASAEQKSKSVGVCPFVHNMMWSEEVGFPGLSTNQLYR